MLLLDVSWADATGTIIAILAFVISLVSFQMSKRRNRIDLRISLVKSRQELYMEIRNWADVVIKTMTETSTLCEFDPKKLPAGDFFHRHVKLICELSYLIDKGRLYLPNHSADTHGIDKPGAYRGLRPEALDRIVAFHDEALNLNYEDKGPNVALQEKLTKAKRQFVSEAQKVLEVREMEVELKELIKHHTRELERKY